ncbi:ABC protein [Daphnia sinensis]|uniref:Fatty acyl-CoA reductase n=1 Tax=Daphnia sinensis TaxID=1820382 RepID=A0AAD5L0P1_9CRUS|nr:ABC protein [Daphnia sinensis]
MAVEAEQQSIISEFYNGRSVFVTGATGFMGKVLVEKLLRACPGIERLYLLMRPSRGQSVECRLQGLIQNQIFDKVKKQQPDVMGKITAVTGDMTSLGLGLSPSNLQLLLDNVSIVFHSAATIRFNEELKTAMRMNVKGPLQLLEICRQMKHLQALVHVSTAFTNFDSEEIKEDVYLDSEINPEELLEFIDCLDEDRVKNMSKQLLGNYPNTYAYTKALAEQLLKERRKSVPLAIVRPSIVTAAQSEPYPGWVDNMNGASGTIAAVGKGLFRILKINEDMISDIIPVDYAINLMIAVAWHTATRNPTGVSVYSCTTGHLNPLTWGLLRRWSIESWLKFPTKDMMWYPGVCYTTNDFLFKISQTLLHDLPAYLMDLFMKATGKRTKWVQLYRKANEAFSTYEFFTTHQWRFISNNPIRLMKEMSIVDRELFYFDVRRINWQNYFETYILGLRLYVLKDDIGSLPLATSNLNRLYWIQFMWLLHVSVSCILLFTAIFYCSVVFVSSDQFHHERNNVACADGVLVRKANKIYGVGNSRCAILEDLDMTVKKGTIYGLLGASGCGKTTLLSCLIGRRRLNSGDILIFGHEPGSEGSGIPGPRVGYMPQDLALHGYFTIKETLHYFGRIYNLKAGFVHAQLEFLSKLLDLPPGDRYVKTLSGGQQRRVSFAVALFHEPKLLILDEPTVGVDPLLRQSIWDHLVCLSTDHGRTVIVTTHYIEEARQANTIGLMRSGRLLTENSPENLLQKYALSSLEDVFLHLCMKDFSHSQQAEAANNADSVGEITLAAQQLSAGIDNDAFERSASQLDVSETPTPSNCHPTAVLNQCPGITNVKSGKLKKMGFELSVKCDVSENVIRQTCNAQSTTKFFSRHRLGALIQKNLLQMFRNVGLFLFIFLLPAIQVILSCLSLGGDLTHLKLAIVNEELDPSQGRVCNYTTTCTYSMFSCRYLRYIDNSTIIQVPFQSVEKAVDATKRGKVWGVVHFGQDFTDELMVRRADGIYSDNETIRASQVAIMLDESNKQVSLTIKRQLIDAFGDFSKDILEACSYQPMAQSVPITFLDPIYGEDKPPFTDFMIPGLILAIIYFLAFALTTGVFLTERKSGLFDRSIVAGVQMTEYMVAHLVNQLIVLVGQILFVYLFALIVFNSACHGNFVLALFITLLQGLCGMSFGILVSVVCDEETSAIQITLGSNYTNLLLAGMLWPMEAMPTYLRYLSNLTPQTYAIQALRNILGRGWGIERREVYMGIVTSLCWIFGLLCLSLIVVRVRKHIG